jgi:hypothetical protein
MATKKLGQKIFFSPFLFFVIVGSGMEENQGPGDTSRIRNTSLYLPLY